MGSRKSGKEGRVASHEHDTLSERIARLEEAQIHTSQAVEALVGELKGIRSEMSRWKGFFGGVIFIVTALWAFVQMGVRAFWQHSGNS